MDFSFLRTYKINPIEINVSEAKKIGRMRHIFFAVPDTNLQQAISVFNPFPKELMEFYNEIGFGFMYRNKNNMDIILDPMSLINTNLQLGYFKEDTFITQALSHKPTDNCLLFFKTRSNHYFSIKQDTIREKNAVFFKDNLISNSLLEFLTNYNKNSNYCSDVIDEYSNSII